MWNYSLIFGIRISGEQEAALLFLEASHKRGAKTALLAAYNKMEPDKFCDGVVRVPSRKHLNHGNVISPQFLALAMPDIIYACYVEQDKYQKKTIHGQYVAGAESWKK